MKIGLIILMRIQISRLQNSVSFAAAKQFFGLTPCKTAVFKRKLLQNCSFVRASDIKLINFIIA